MREKGQKILVLNNYSITRVLGEIRAGLKPSHHLYGIVELLESEYKLLIIDPENNRFWSKIQYVLSKFFFLNLGNISIQLKALRRRKEYDIIYAPCQDVTLLLGLLNYFGLFKKPIIAVAHHSFLIGKLLFIRKLFLGPILKGHFKWGCLSTRLVQEVNSITGKDEAVCLHWGPDIQYYQQILKQQSTQPTVLEKIDLVAIGRTGRDYHTLIKAFYNTSVSIEIYCAKEVALPLLGMCSNNMKIIGLESAESLTYPELIAIYKRSKIMAIPLFHQKSLAGLTSITDATALSMPMIITKNALIEPDIEAQGAGFWVEAGNTEQWMKAVESILSHGKTNEMGMASFKLSENQFNSTIYYREIFQLIQQANSTLQKYP